VVAAAVGAAVAADERQQEHQPSLYRHPAAAREAARLNLNNIEREPPSEEAEREVHPAGEVLQGSHSNEQGP